jgi:hypothetical protein
MKTSPDFIGLGVEKAGTSWIFACLYEHPEICIPKKEVNFFSEKISWDKGNEWYESYFRTRCPSNRIKGEFSTSYFYHSECAKRIQKLYPETQLIVCLRDPIDRAISGYLNAIKAGNISTSTSFKQAINLDNQYLDQGKYKVQFQRYLKYFTRSQLLILVYEDSLVSPKAFIQSIYRFLKVNDRFIPPSLHERINTARVPGNIEIEKWSNRIAARLQEHKVGEKLWWLVKKSKIPKIIRKLNTKTLTKPQISKETFEQLRSVYLDDVTYVENLLDRKLDWLGEKNL